MTEHRSNNNNDNNNDDGDNPSSPPMTTTMVTTSRIAFGSCHKSEISATPPIWETILPPESESEHEPTPQTQTRMDAWLWLGDAMYPSHRDPITNKKYYGPAPPEEIEAGLKAMKHENATIGYKDFLERLAETNNNRNNNNNNNNNKKRSSTRPLVTGVWDDHDFGGNDMGVGMPSKPERRKIYRDFLGHPSTAEPRTPWSTSGNNSNGNSNARDFSSSSSSHDEGMYHRIDLEGGRIRILVLDTRWFREDHCIPSVAHSIPKGNAVACLTRWLTSVRSLFSWDLLAVLYCRSHEFFLLLYCIVLYIVLREFILQCKTHNMSPLVDFYIIPWQGLLLHKYAWLWGRGGCEYAKVLGDEQWAWLENELLVESVRTSSLSTSAEEEAPELFVILSSIQVWSTNPLMEGWGHFPKEQERLWNLLRTHYNNNNDNDDDDGRGRTLSPAPVLFLSGDVHHAEISGMPGYYEVTSSGLTHHCGQHKLYGPVCEPILLTFTGHRHGGDTNDNDNGYYIGLNYGVLEILEEEDDGGGAALRKRAVRVSIRNTTGHSVLGVVQPLAGHGLVPVLPPYDEIAHTWDGHLIPYAEAISLWAVIGLVSVLFLRLR
jgi:hypothetical protein